MNSTQGVKYRLILTLLVERKAIIECPNPLSEKDPHKLSERAYEKVGGLYEWLHKKGAIKISENLDFEFTEKCDKFFEELQVSDWNNLSVRLRTAVYQASQKISVYSEEMYYLTTVMLETFKENDTESLCEYYTPEDFAVVLDEAKREAWNLRVFLNLQK